MRTILLWFAFIILTRWNKPFYGRKCIMYKIHKILNFHRIHKILLAVLKQLQTLEKVAFSISFRIAKSINLLIYFWLLFFLLYTSENLSFSSLNLLLLLLTRDKYSEATFDQSTDLEHAYFGVSGRLYCCHCLSHTFTLLFGIKKLVCRVSN